MCMYNLKFCRFWLSRSSLELSVIEWLRMLWTSWIRFWLRILRFWLLNWVIARVAWISGSFVCVFYLGIVGFWLFWFLGFSDFLFGCIFGYDLVVCVVGVIWGVVFREPCRKLFMKDGWFGMGGGRLDDRIFIWGILFSSPGCLLITRGSLRIMW